MKRIIFITIAFFLIILFQSCSKKNRALDSESMQCNQKIHVLSDINELTSLDSLISRITIVPLETNEDCLIKNIFAAKLNDDLLFINSDRRQLLVYDLNGKYIRDIGSRGQGPGELLEIRDFIFTNEGNIEILDFKKIEIYSLEGEHLGTKKYDFMGKDIYCNPMNFCQSSHGYYVWGGTIGLTDNKLLKQSYMMHHVDPDMKIDGHYFSAHYGDGGTMDRFKHYQNYIIVIPSSIDYNIYQIDPKGNISVRYCLDFGKYGVNSNKKIDLSSTPIENYITRISNYYETDRFIHLNFNYKNNMYSMFYSKAEQQSYIKSLAKPFETELRFYPIIGTYNDQMIAIIEASWIKAELERMSPEGIKKWELEQYHQLDEDSNPMLIFYTLK